MQYIDVFNGDADGICALHQLRLAEPQDSTLITGVKRDIALLERVDAQAGDRVTVLDVSLDRNRESLLRLLGHGVQLRYFDHHFPGDIPSHPNLECHIDTDKTVCTSILVNRYLGGEHLAWAVTAAFGDNLHDSAKRIAAPLGLSPEQLALLEKLGTCINYNGYGTTLQDLYFHPAELYRHIQAYTDPFDFIHADAGYRVLVEGYQSDLQKAQNLVPELQKEYGALYLLPDTAWARRVSGVFANELARRFPQRAHALVTRSPGGHYVVSVRAPLSKGTGADTLCRQFATGGGRQSAAGINVLPDSELERFTRLFFSSFDD